MRRRRRSLGAAIRTSDFVQSHPAGRRCLDVLDADQEKEEQNVFQLAWEATVGAAAEALENQPADQLATRVPLSGTVENPETEFWPTFVNVLRNAFVEAFAQRLENSQ